MRYLTLSAILRLHENLKHEFDIIDGEIKEGKIQTILNKLKETPYSENEKYDSIYKKAACLVEGLVRGHCFPDANKRTALLATFTFLQANDHHLVIPLNTIEFLVRVARDESETEEEIDALIYEISDWLEDRTATNSKDFVSKSKKYILRPLKILRIISFTGIGLIYAYYALNKWLVTKYHPEYKQKLGSILKFIDGFFEDSIKALENIKSQNTKEKK